MSVSVIDYLPRLSALSGVAVESLAAIGFQVQAASLAQRGVTPEQSAKWLSNSAEILAEIQREKGVNLLDKGFAPKLYSDQDGIFLSKTLPVSHMPYMMEKVVDEEFIFSGSDAVMEICPDKTVLLYISDSDYDEKQNGYLHDEGWALLADAFAN